MISPCDLDHGFAATAGEPPATRYPRDRDPGDQFHGSVRAQDLDRLQPEAAEKLSPVAWRRFARLLAEQLAA